MTEMKNSFAIYVRMPEGRFRHSEKCIKMDLKQIGCEDVD
jgi:hypothetical protein